ncbi:hypothetical protein CEXT_791591 [Caerostris extrusa]|uniref:Uncharacterized protein n=1 Tax=Caerostris extrusa TaxID=172846 RepID=A0AAV4VQJ7_CAEEX|nr:hypothetical protein CEXT_791591 [Caerostris extrusa]
MPYLDTMKEEDDEKNNDEEMIRKMKFGFGMIPKRRCPSCSPFRQTAIKQTPWHYQRSISLKGKVSENVIGNLNVPQNVTNL